MDHAAGDTAIRAGHHHVIGPCISETHSTQYLCRARSAWIDYADAKVMAICNEQFASCVHRGVSWIIQLSIGRHASVAGVTICTVARHRSEERRVGTEC